jgi:hypothetical protein
MNIRRGESLDRVTESLVQWAGSGTMIIDHMVRWASAHPEDCADKDPFDSLRSIVRGTLAPLEDRHAAVDLNTAATVLADAVETLASEILLVDPDPPVGHDRRDP